MNEESFHKSLKLVPMLIIPFVVVLGTSLGTVNFSFGSFLSFLAEMVEQNEFPIVMGEEQNPLRLWSKLPYITIQMAHIWHPSPCAVFLQHTDVCQNFL